MSIQAKYGGLGLALLVRAWMGTLRYKALYHDETADAGLHPTGDRRFIYVFWHEYIPYQLYLRGHCNVCMLLSTNRDAEWLAQANQSLGFFEVRGSSYRGGYRALRQLLHAGRTFHLAITPDGPRGPRRKFAFGPIYLASKMRMPIVPIGMGYDRPRRLTSWDQFAVPRLFSRARAVMGSPIEITSNQDRAALEAHRVQLGKVLNDLTFQAEDWAASGASRAGEVRVRRQSAPRVETARRPLRLRPCDPPSQQPGGTGRARRERSGGQDTSHAA